LATKYPAPIAEFERAAILPDIMRSSEFYNASNFTTKSKNLKEVMNKNGVIVEIK
jgi:hypothetical protein